MASADLGVVHAVSDVQGLEGVFQFPERLLQKVWHRREWEESAARTEDGRALSLQHPGRWNRLGGPDFRDASLRLDGVGIIGDIEVHLHAADWRAHGHAEDRAYDRVVLHVVLFPPGLAWTRGGEGRRIPILCLLPRLLRGLEELAAEDVLERWADPGAVRCEDRLFALGEDERFRELRRAAEDRWGRKCAGLRQRVERLGWEEACHQAALEVLGYRFNRVAMLRVATGWPLAMWRSPGMDVTRLLDEQGGRWTRQGIRPANQPRLRLQQYAAWVRSVPNWPQRLAELRWPDPPEFVNARPEDGRRQRLVLADFRRTSVYPLTGCQLAGPRLDTLVCDALLPLVAAIKADERFGRLWWHWFPGDLPAQLLRTLAALGLVGPGRPRLHGLAQGLLGWRIAHERLATSGAASPELRCSLGAPGLTMETADR
jgi:hypothetical protein